MTGGVLNPPVFLYSADYEALTENTILYHRLDRRPQGWVSPRNEGFGGQTEVGTVG